MLILAALVAVYIVLGVLYESYVHPITILSTLPSAGVGAVLALMLFDTEFSIIALIGVILLIGIVKKNAIMMIDFALDAERSEGLSPREAIYQACLLRFRPIMMTTMAAMLGALPLAIGFGDGSELRRPLGISIVGGLIVSQLLTLYTTPVVYLYLDRFRLWARRGPAATGTAPSVAARSPANERNVSSRLRRARGAAALLLAACTVGPDYQRPAAPVPAAIQGGRRLEARPSPRRRPATRRLVDDLSTIRCSTGSSARSTSPTRTLKAAEAAYRQAQALVAEARARLFPDRDRSRGSAQRSRPRPAARGSASAGPSGVAAARRTSSSSPPTRAGRPISGAASAAPSRARSPAPRRAPPISPPRGSRRRRRSPPTISSCASPTSRSACSTPRSVAFTESLQITQQPVRGGIAGQSTCCRPRPSSSRRRRRRSRRRARARSSSMRSRC